ncbi:thioredoxin-disulfide reductase [Peptoniphilus asaccharolyticus]
MYDLIILGAGPAGLTAGIYASRASLNVLIIEKGIEGGQIANTVDVENYPGIKNVSGMELGMTMREQAEEFGCEFAMDEVVSVELEGETKKIVGKFGEYEGKTVIIAAGASPRPMGAKGEEEFSGRGVSYCATCDAAFYQDLEVYVVGGGNSAVEEALFITRFAKKVHIIHRRDKLRATEAVQQKAFANEKIDFIWDSTIEEVKGEKMVNEIVLKNLKTGEVTNIKPSEPFGLFVFIGYEPQTEIFKDQIELENGYIRTDDDMKTNIEGVFAAGDIRVKNVRQVVTAAADGAIAALSADRYIDEKEGTLYEGLK